MSLRSGVTQKKTSREPFREHHAHDVFLWLGWLVQSTNTALSASYPCLISICYILVAKILINLLVASPNLSLSGGAPLLAKLVYKCTTPRIWVCSRYIYT